MIRAADDQATFNRLHPIITVLKRNNLV
jgi:hypothetical protein